ncbi:MAG: alkyl hydroperoxide reductase subunit C [Lactobacillaceae bacterium]|uniref:alkyl hydroperoxide reductase subunit C n=1 Tax=Limosilactobacillus sp. TaxID=2773925 RepID=UPI002A74A791|nr:alkyl hydroperoxide reductase subunit C [Limosilactobacillus sp.]MDD7693465.1 alkyl hydroperoxide reductase subunit C [Lactobacillaceae bacterium]MDY2803083.1 alkyl hydroperoxide reductase subunit C [Limosilactobacillus sp.]
MNFVGHEIEDFKVNAYQDGKTVEVTKKDVLGKWSIFFFYPADFSFVCPTELEALQDKYEDFKQANAEIYSVSEDTEFVHKAWAEASDKIGKIKYHMLADPAGKLARMFDVLDEDAGQAYRGVFIVDPDGKIQSYTINNMGIGRSADEILRTLLAAQFVRKHGDRVCPANWKPGQDSIKPSLDLVGKL